MNWNRREDWPRQAREAVACLETRNIPVPKPVAAAVAVLDRIESSRPQQPEPTEIRRAIVDGATPEAITALLIADATFAKLKVEWSQARVDAAGAVLGAVLNAADQILPPLTKLAERCIESLVAVAALDGARLDDLVRAGRTSDAELVANVDVIAAELDSHFEYRDRYLTRGGALRLAVGGINASRWRDPLAASHRASGSGTPAERYVRGLRAGVPLWFPTPADAIEVAQDIANQEAEKQAQVKAAQHGVGSLAY